MKRIQLQCKHTRPLHHQSMTCLRVKLTSEMNEPLFTCRLNWCKIWQFLFLGHGMPYSMHSNKRRTHENYLLPSCHRQDKLQLYQDFSLSWSHQVASLQANDSTFGGVGHDQMAFQPSCWLPTVLLETSKRSELKIYHFFQEPGQWNPHTYTRWWVDLTNFSNVQWQKKHQSLFMSHEPL